MRRAALSLLVLLGPGAAVGRAQDDAGCAKFKWSVARERAAFAVAGLPTVASGEVLPSLGTAARAKLLPQAGVAFPHAPGRKPKADPAYAAVLTMPPLASPGTYAVTLSEDAWIDVLQDGKEVRSSGFSGQADCPGLRKSVKFALQPGPAVLQVSGAATDALNLDVLPAE